MILIYEVYGDDVYQPDEDKCFEYKLYVHRDDISGDGWNDDEYDVIFSRDNPLVSALPYSYSTIVTIKTTDESGFESIKPKLIWVNFISKIQGD